MHFGAGGLFILEDDSGVEDDDKEGSDIDDGDLYHWGMDHDEDESDSEEVENYWEGLGKSLMQGNQ